MTTIEFLNSDAFINGSWAVGFGLCTIIAILMIIFTDIKAEEALGIVMLGVFTHYVLAGLAVGLFGAITWGAGYSVYWLLKSIRKVIPFKPIKLHGVIS